MVSSSSLVHRQSQVAAQATNIRIALVVNTQPSLTPVTTVESLVWPLSITHAPLLLHLSLLSISVSCSGIENCRVSVTQYYFLAETALHANIHCNKLSV